MNSKKKFDYEGFEQEAIRQLQNGIPLSGKNGVLAPLLKRLLEAGFHGELNDHLWEEKASSPDISNRRNGVMRKRVKTGYGSMEVATPRDREGSFDPKLLPKRQTVLGEGLEHKIIGLYALGMSYSDICDHLEEMYRQLSPSSITAITDKILPEIEQWQTRPLEEVYPIVWLDAIHCKVRENNTIRSKAVYYLIGVNRDGEKDLLGMYIGQSESARFWLTVLNDIQHRGVKDILIASIDNLKGFAQAIEAVFPKTKVQLCIVHQIRNSLKYAAQKDYKLMVDSMRRIYQAVDRSQAEKALSDFDLMWRNKYPAAVNSWIDNWERLAQMFDFPDQIRRLIYTTNIIERFNSQLRKVTKSKRVFTNDKALIKLLYLVQKKIMERSGKISGWKVIMVQFMIIFDTRWKYPSPLTQFDE